jgi:hypothetical protein
LCVLKIGNISESNFLELLLLTHEHPNFGPSIQTEVSLGSHPAGIFSSGRLSSLHAATATSATSTAATTRRTSSFSFTTLTAAGGTLSPLSSFRFPEHPFFFLPFFLKPLPAMLE